MNDTSCTVNHKFILIKYRGFCNDLGRAPNLAINLPQQFFVVSRRDIERKKHWAAGDLEPDIDDRYLTPTLL